MIKRRTMAVLGLATVLAGGAGTGMAYAAGGTGSAPTVKAVPGAHPDLSKVKLGTAVPLGKVTGVVGGGKTTAAPGAADTSTGTDPGTVTLTEVPGAKPDLSKAVPGTAVAVGPVTIVGGSGDTLAR